VQLTAKPDACLDTSTLQIHKIYEERITSCPLLLLGYQQYVSGLYTVTIQLLCTGFCTKMSETYSGMLTITSFPQTPLLSGPGPQKMRFGSQTWIVVQLHQQMIPVKA
jgi:hypothetical protein